MSLGVVLTDGTHRRCSQSLRERDTGFPLGSSRSGYIIWTHWAPWTPPSSHPRSGERSVSGRLSMKWDWQCLLHRACPPCVPEVLKCWFPSPEAFCVTANWPWTFHLDLVIYPPPGAAKRKHPFPAFPTQRRRLRG